MEKKNTENIVCFSLHCAIHTITQALLFDSSSWIIIVIIYLRYKSFTFRSTHVSTMYELLFYGLLLCIKQNNNNNDVQLKKNCRAK